MKTKQIYEQKIVLFIDILGFKDLVKKSESDNIFLKLKIVK